MQASRLTLEQIAEPANLRAAFLRAARGKSHRAEVIAYRADLKTNLAALREQLLTGTTQVGRYTQFRIFEPKERIIHAPVFAERVLHHALIGPAEADFERWSTADNYACRRGKGREAALRRAEHFARRHGWFLKLDVRKYFDSIPHATLLAHLAPRWRDRRVVALWSRIIAAYETTPGCGLPIGALTSQHLANFYLRAVDLAASQLSGVTGHVRYMDDMALWADDKAALIAAKLALETQLSAQGLTLKSTWHLQPAARGMDFLGYRVYPGGSRLARPSRRRFLRRWGWIERARESGAITATIAQNRVLALTAFVRVARCEPLLRRLFGRIPWGDGHRAPTASIAAAVGTTPPTTAVRPTATTTSASASPSAQVETPAQPSN